MSFSDRRLTTRRLALEEWARRRDWVRQLATRHLIAPESAVLFGRDVDGRRYFEGGFPNHVREREEDLDG